jgi:hypothetical protein
MALIKASRSDVENCRHSKRTLGLALQAAAAAVCTVAAASSALACVEFSNPSGKSFPASASAGERVWNFGNADDGRLGLVLGSNDADATETASKRTSDRMAWDWDLKGSREYRKPWGTCCYFYFGSPSFTQNTGCPEYDMQY